MLKLLRFIAPRSLPSFPNIRLFETRSKWIRVGDERVKKIHAWSEKDGWNARGQGEKLGWFSRQKLRYRRRDPLLLPKLSDYSSENGEERGATRIDGGATTVVGGGSTPWALRLLNYAQANWREKESGGRINDFDRSRHPRKILSPFPRILSEK